MFSLADNCASVVNAKTSDTSILNTLRARHTIYSYFDFGLKNSSFRLPYQRPSSSADCAKELFKGANGSASLGLGVQIFLWVSS